MAVKERIYPDKEARKIRGGMGRGGPGGGPAMLAVPAQKAKDFKGTLKKLLAYLKPQINVLVIIIIFAVLSTVFAIAAPKIIAANITNPLAKAISTRGASADWNAIFTWIVIIAAIFVVANFLSFLSNFISVKLSQNVVYKMRNDIKAKLNKLPLKYYDNTSTGNTLSVITNDIDLISTTLQQSLTQIITSIVTVIGVFIMMLTISIWMSLVTLLTIPAFSIFTIIIMKKSQTQFIRQQANLGELNGHIEEIYNGQTEVKLFNKESRCAEDFEKINAKLTAASIKAQFLSGTVFPVLHFINNISYVGVVIVGSILAGGSPPLSLGDIQAFLQYSNSFSQPILNTAQLANVIQSTIAAAERVFDILEQEEEKQSGSGKTIKEGLEGDVVFENVSFSYSKDKKLIENLNLDFKSGSKIAIVGPTGAGKTTLVNLLMRFYDIDGGAIYIDGHNIYDISRRSLRDVFGMVLQDTWLFSGTIKDNIAYGNENATMEDIIEAAKKAHIHHYIMTLKDGYDTVLSENASNISQGQKQLLTIARAILKQPKILILDEATSSVDTRTEQLIQNAMNAMTEGRTSFIIAHRLSTIKNAAVILVIDGGKVIERGSHSELMENKGFYYRLYSSQFLS
jgi:ATP-binding cassette subfamily B multidrug efflux pump